MIKLSNILEMYSRPEAEVTSDSDFKPDTEHDKERGMFGSEGVENEDHEVSMAQSALEDIIKNATELKDKIGQEEKDIPAWIQDHISQSQNFISQANTNYHEYGQEEDELTEGEYCPECLIEVLEGLHEGQLGEAEYHGRKVPLGKIMRGDVKKFKVFVRDPKSGNVKKVNFGHGGTSAKRRGEKTMKIKKYIPSRRKAFRARHRCATPGPRTKARYWACRTWE
jgi:hypothetical protein